MFSPGTHILIYTVWFVYVIDSADSAFTFPKQTTVKTYEHIVPKIHWIFTVYQKKLVLPTDKYDVACIKA